MMMEMMRQSQFYLQACSTGSSVQWMNECHTSVTRFVVKGFHLFSTAERPGLTPVY